MSQISTNITPKYRQETHYNYVQNSEFVASSFTGKERDSETGFSYGNAIAKPPAFSYSPLLHYRKAYRANS